MAWVSLQSLDVLSDRPLIAYRLSMLREHSGMGIPYNLWMCSCHWIKDTSTVLRNHRYKHKRTQRYRLTYPLTCSHPTVHRPHYYMDKCIVSLALSGDSRASHSLSLLSWSPASLVTTGKRIVTVPLLIPHVHADSPTFPTVLTCGSLGVSH